MPIEAQCPHCRKPYKFKDEFVGKRVKCAAAGCRQVFEVKVMSKEDLEAVALAAIVDNPDPVAAAPEDQRKVKVICSACEHVWEEPWAKQGKNTVCPECRHRQKVPEEKGEGKKVDWRDPKSGRPTLAKVEDVPEDVWGSSKSNVSVKALKDAGAIPEIEYEPRPLKQKIYFGLGGVGLVLALLLGTWAVFFRGREAGLLDRLMKEAVAASAGMKDTGMTPASAAAAEGVLRIYDGEYQARLLNDGRLKAALDQFAGSRMSLDAAPKGIERDAALTEWLAAVVSLGGDENQATGRIKIRWEPAASQARARINEKEYSVVEELQSGFSILQKATDFDTRVATFRRITETLAGVKQTKLLPSLLGQGFAPNEFNEVQGYLGLDLFRLGEETGAKAIATELDGTIAEKDKAPGSVRALWHVTGVKPLAVIGPGNVGIQTRLALALAKAVEKKGGDAAEEAMRPGSTNDQFRVMALCADTLEDSSAVVDKAAELLNTVRNNREAMAGVAAASWASLARAAGRVGKDEAARRFSSAPLTDDGKAHAVAELMRGKLAAIGNQKADPAWADVPEDAKMIKVGHLIARAMIARHNGRVTGDAGLAKDYESWPKGTVRPFGYAGLVLGLQDRNQP
ncbi:MAG TPA: hypothetical protein VGJ05_22540 [Fimbriiglobus sp.]|jgi:hypothetical protein